ncbi:glycosyl hydrolase family 18 protein [Microbacterium luticocti]|uniref:glycosyl hydrolase family 18 protein n=1 Tax=Microbacterium luticocti TaxID=451764 RepID=UPI000685B6E7|nr:glycosyl hydrolase family 18 protein [Microbacterium luticocti]
MARVSHRLSALVAAVVGALVAGALAALPAAAAPASVADVDAGTTSLNGYRSVAYYGGWQATGGAKATLKRLFVGSATSRNITHLDYAFGNIAGSQQALDDARRAGAQGLDDTRPYTCFASDAAAGPAGQTEAAGSARDDFVRTYSAADSVLGIADTATQKLAGTFNQLRQLKRLHPDLKVNISLGGWSYSASFSAAVSTPQRREQLASSCIDLYIKGNLPVIDGRGGPGAAAGVFDGFDLDWEWPGAPSWAQQAGNSVDEQHDAANFLAFVHELRRQLDALTATTGRHYEISAFLPASPTVITAGGWNVPALFHDLDYGNLQGYDLWGSWADTTGYQAGIHGDAAHNWGLGLDTIVASYTQAGIDPAQLNLGMPAYGQGWKDAAARPWASGVGIGQQSWDALKARGLQVHHDYTAGGEFNATWGYDPATGQFWSFDDPFAVAEKTRWATRLGLGGVDFWDLGQDVRGDLPAAAATVLRAAPRGPVAGRSPVSCRTTPNAKARAWNAQRTYHGGDRVYLDGHVYEALWYAKGEQPGAASAGPWSTLTACGVDPATVQQWYPDRVYRAGDQVIHRGVTYTAQWWTRGQTPGRASGPWHR